MATTSLKLPSNTHRTLTTMCKYIPNIIILSLYGHFQKGIVRKNRSTQHLSAVGMLFPFLGVAGPQLNAVVLQGSARFAQGFDRSARQAPETGEQMILANSTQLLKSWRFCDFVSSPLGGAFW